MTARHKQVGCINPWCGGGRLCSLCDPKPVVPEPKAPASDLDAAVGSIRQMIVDCEAEPDLPMMIDAHTCVEHAGQLRLLLSALSSQSQAAEGMAKALENSLYALESAREMIAATKGTQNPNRNAAINQARTALSAYRTPGDRHVD